MGMGGWVDGGVVSVGWWVVISVVVGGHSGVGEG